MIDRHELQIVPANLAQTIPLEKNQLIYITPDGFGVAEHLKKIIERAGSVVKVVKELPSSEGHFFILLDGLQTFHSIDDAIQCQKKVFANIKNIAAHCEKKPLTIFIVQNTGGQFGLSAITENQAWSAGLSALAKTIKIEWPHIHCKAIDVATQTLSKEEIAETLFEEMSLVRPEVECGIVATQQRITIQTNLIPFSKKEPLSVDRNDVFVVTGGGRGVTAACLLELAKKSRPRFAILGRSALFDEPLYLRHLKEESQLKQAIFAEGKNKGMQLSPKDIQSEVNKIIANREIALTLKQLNEAGSESIYFSVDILNEDSIKKALAAVRLKFNVITGLIHAAGVLADKLIAQKTIEQFNHVFDTKIKGLKNLLHLTQADPLRFIIFFSSVAARYGNVGQCDYAMANETLNKIAQYEQQKRGSAAIVKSLNWGPWESGMVTPELKAAFKKRGIPVLSLEAGAQGFVDEFEQNGVEIVLGGTLESDFAVNVNIHSHPYFSSHQIKEQIVVPAFSALDWMIQAATKKNDAFFKIKQFKLLSGILLPDFLSRQFQFKVTYDDSQAKLCGNENKLHYSAMLEPIKQLSSYPVLLLESKAKKKPWPWPIEEIYANPYHFDNQKRLFHGPDFAAIQELVYVNDQGGKGWLTGLTQKAWPGKFKIDVLALDGALQLIYLWGLMMLGKRSLPTSIGEIEFFQSSLPNTNLVCTFISTLKNNQQTLSDAMLVDEKGLVYAKLNQIEMSVIS